MTFESRGSTVWNPLHASLTGIWQQEHGACAVTCHCGLPCTFCPVNFWVIIGLAVYGSSHEPASVITKTYQVSYMETCWNRVSPRPRDGSSKRHEFIKKNEVCWTKGNKLYINLLVELMKNVTKTSTEISLVIMMPSIVEMFMTFVFYFVFYVVSCINGYM